MSTSIHSRRLLAGSVALAIAVSLGSAASSFAATRPAAAAARSAASFTLDNVALKVNSPDLPAGTFTVAAPGAQVQAASVVQDSPFSYFAVTAVPYGQTLPESSFPVSKPGDAAAWSAALHGDRNGPVATVFGQQVRGTVLRSQGDLTTTKGKVTVLESVQWIVSRGGRTWVFTLQHDQSHLSKAFGTHLDISSPDPDARTTVVPGKATVHAEAAAVPIGGSLGRPYWWNSTCDGNGTLLNSGFMGLQVCGGGGGGDDYVPGVTQLEWQCADLSDRYLVQRYGITGAGGNGNQEAQNAYNAYPSQFDLYTNGDHVAPEPGDVLSFAVGGTGAGHTGVVYQSDVDTSGNGTVYFVDQNFGSDGGYNQATVTDWNVENVVSSQGGTVQWLHGHSAIDGVGVWRPSDNTFYLSDSNTSGPTDVTQVFGSNADGDVPLAGDWDDSGKTGYGVFDPTNHTFYLHDGDDSDAGKTDITVSFGTTGDVPVVGDWYGNGETTIGVWRPSTHTFWFPDSNTDATANHSQVYGAAGDLPVTGDWNNSGVTGYGVFRPSDHTFYLHDGDNGNGGSDDITTSFGTTGDQPVSGDWYGNGQTTIGVWRPSTHTFWFPDSNTDGDVNHSQVYGAAGDEPVTGHWNG